MGELQEKDLTRFLILGGILTARSSWKPPFGDPFRKCLGEQTGDRAIDLGCALEHGAFEAVRDPAPDDRQLQDTEVSDAETSLIFFVTRLLYRLQQMSSVPAIDYPEYGRAFRRT